MCRTKVRKGGMEPRERRVGWNQGEEGWDGTRVRKVGWNQEREGWDGTKVRKGGMEPG